MLAVYFRNIPYINTSAADISRRQHMVADTCCYAQCVCFTCVSRVRACSHEFIERRRVWEPRFSSLLDARARETFISADFSLSGAGWRSHYFSLSTMLLDMRVYAHGTRREADGEPARDNGGDGETMGESLVWETLLRIYEHTRSAKSVSCSQISVRERSLRIIILLER